MKNPDILPSGEKEPKETSEQQAIMDGFAMQANFQREIDELKRYIDKIEKSKTTDGYKVVDRRLGMEKDNLDNNTAVVQAEQRIRELEEMVKNSTQKREEIMGGKKDKTDSIEKAEEGKAEEQKSEPEIVQDELKEEKAIKIDELAEQELADQTGKNKEEPISDSDPDVIIPEILPPDKNESGGSIIDIKSEDITESAGVPAVFENPGDPSREQMLEKLLEVSRKAYVELDYKMDKDSSPVRKFFGLSRKKLGNYNDAFETAKLNYESKLRAYVKEKIKGGVISSEKAESLTNFILRDEFVKLAEVRDETRIEKSPHFEKLKRGSQKVIDRYRKLPLWAKMSVGTGLAATGVGVGVMAGYRIFGGAVAATGYKQMFEGIAQKLQGKKDEKEIMGTIKNSKIEGMGPVQRELLLKNLETAIQNIDQKIQKRKQTKRWRTWMAVGAGVGTMVVGQKVGEWVGNKFHDAADYINEKAQGVSEYFQKMADNLKFAKPSGAAAYMEGMEGFRAEDVPDMSNIPPSGAAGYMEGMEGIRAEDFPDLNENSSAENIQMEPIENVEKFDELADKPFEEIKGEESLNMEPDKIQTEVEIDESKLADTIPDAKTPDAVVSEVPIANGTQEFDNLDNKPLEELQEEIPKIDQRTESRVFYKDGQIDSVIDVDTNKPQYNFDPMDKVEVGQGSINNIIPESSPTEVPEIVKTEVAPEKESIITENSAQNELQSGSVFQNEDAVPEQGRPGAESYPQGLEHVEKIREGIDKLLSTSNDPDQIMIFLRREFSLDNIDNWRGIRASSVDSLISDRSTGDIGGKVSSLINKLEFDYNLGKDIKPLYGETIESWTRRAGEMLMESKNN